MNKNELEINVQCRNESLDVVQALHFKKDLSFYKSGQHYLYIVHRIN